MTNPAQSDQPGNKIPTDEDLIDEYDASASMGTYELVQKARAAGRAELREKCEGLCNAYGGALIEIHDLKKALETAKAEGAAEQKERDAAFVERIAPTGYVRRIAEAIRAQWEEK